MAGLTAKKCSAKAAKLNETQVAALLTEVPGWEVAQEGGGELVRVFAFRNYYESMAFVNATAWISNGEDHHPDIELGYNRVKMRYSTHSAGGLTENDFICAAKVDALLTV